MITGFFLQIFYGFLSFFVALLPTTGFPVDISSAIATVWGYVNALSFLLPVTTLLTVLGLAMTFHGAVLLWRLIHMVASYVRGR